MKVLITGANGQLGLAFQKELTRQGIPFYGTDVMTCDITNPAQVNALLDQHQPTVLINCAAYNLVDLAELKPDLAFSVNAQAVKVLAESCQARSVKLIHYSTDYVFDGQKKDLYVEDDAPHPLNVYGKSKLEGEQNAGTLVQDHLVLRTSWLYGHGPQNFLYKVSQWAQKEKVLRIAADEVSVPTSVDVLVDVTLRALNKKLTGLYHATSSGYASRFELAKYFLRVAGFAVSVVPVPMSSFPSKVARPLFSAMSSRKISLELGIKIPVWQEGVDQFARLKKMI